MGDKRFSFDWKEKKTKKFLTKSSRKSAYSRCASLMRWSTSAAAIFLSHRRFASVWRGNAIENAVAEYRRARNYSGNVSLRAEPQSDTQWDLCATLENAPKQRHLALDQTSGGRFKFPFRNDRRFLWGCDSVCIVSHFLSIEIISKKWQKTICCIIFRYKLNRTYFFHWL